MNTEQIQQLKDEIKLALAAMASQAVKTGEDGKANFMQAIALFWDEPFVHQGVCGAVTGWLLAKGVAIEDQLGDLIVETKNEFLQEYQQ